VTETFTHYDNGQVYQSTDAKATLQPTPTVPVAIAPDQCEPPLSLSNRIRELLWGVESQANDFNNQPTYFKYNDPMWRLDRD